MILNSRYLVEIDVLLDSRLGTVAQLDQDTAHEIMKDPSYMLREMDNFCANRANVSDVAYQAAYRKRDKVTLASSTRTHFISVLTEMMMGDHRDPMFNFQERSIELHINLYPYKLDEFESNQILLIMGKLIPGPFKMRTVYYPKTSISPHFIKANGYTTVAMYDLLPWIETQKGNFELVQIPETTLVGPEILKEIPDYSKIDVEFRTKLQEFGHFRAAEFAMLPYANLFLMGASIFSCGLIPMPEKLNKA